MSVLEMFDESGVSRECWVARGTLSNGSPFFSRQFVGGPLGYETFEQAKSRAEHLVAHSRRCGGSLEAVRQVLNPSTMLWEDS